MDIGLQHDMTALLLLGIQHMNMQHGHAMPCSMDMNMQHELGHSCHGEVIDMDTQHGHGHGHDA
jgi:hypothetical protein